MPYKSIETRRLKQKLQKQQKRSKNNVSLDVSPVSLDVSLVSPVSLDVSLVSPVSLDVSLVSPVEPNPFIYDIMRFELLFDTIRMKELLLRKTRFNVWLNYHLSVLEELQIYFHKK